jgi:hypothetical protein
MIKKFIKVGNRKIYYNPVDEKEECICDFCQINEVRRDRRGLIYSDLLGDYGSIKINYPGHYEKHNIKHHICEKCLHEKFPEILKGELSI